MADSTNSSRYKRVLLKLSGEALMGEGKYGIHPPTLTRIATEVREVSQAGVELAVVIGGGNIFRGVAGSTEGMDRASADYMGMLATCINAMALQDALEKQGLQTRVLSAIKMEQIAEPYIRRRAVRHLEKGRVVIFGAGAGMPYFTSDTVAAQRALEIHADLVLMSKNGVDGVYTADPRTDTTARKLDMVTFDEALRRGLKVVDAAAFSLCMENGLPMLVFAVEGEDTILQALRGDKIGTLVLPISMARGREYHHSAEGGGGDD